MEKVNLQIISTLDIPPAFYSNITNNYFMDRKIALLITIIVFISILNFSNFFVTETETKIKIIPENITPVVLEETKILKNITRTTARIKVPAVDSEGNGVVTTLKVETIPGSGKILVNINQLLFWVDTQFSIRVAKMVAGNITGKTLSDVDLTYDIETAASLIEGQSAGAALTIATVAALQNKTINESVIITGTINADGSIGPVGAIVVKAKAAKDVNAKLFLVPFGQGVQISYKPVKYCEKIGPLTYCTVEYKQEKIDITKEAGIEVREVSNINEALKYFLQ